MTVPSKPSSLIKPTLDTRFHIDYDWWQRQSGEDLRVYLLSHLSHEQRDRLSQIHEDHKVDYIDPETGEVFQLDEIGIALKTASEDESFINQATSLVDSIFRALLKHNNLPLSSRELGTLTGRPATTILKMLSGGQIYKGIRPYLGE